MYSFVSSPQAWTQGTSAFERFRELYPHRCEMYGYETRGGHLDHDTCNRKMAEGFFTEHFKDLEAYGLTCLESMMLGTPIVSLHRLMAGKSLGAFFLDETNAVLADTVEELIERLLFLSIEEYRRLSENARERVLELTSDERTVAKLKAAICASEKKRAKLLA